MFDRVPVELEDEGVTLGVGDAPGTQVVVSPVVVPADGALEVRGSVHALICADDSVSTDALVARVDGVEVARSTQEGLHYALADEAWDLVIADVLATVGLAADTTAFSPEIWREGAGGGRSPANVLLYPIQAQLGSNLATTTLPYRGNGAVPDQYGTLTDLPPRTAAPPQVRVVGAGPSVLGPQTLADHEVLRFDYAASGR